MKCCPLTRAGSVSENEERETEDANGLRDSVLLRDTLLRRRVDLQAEAST
jgi:hypothetical protein